MIATAGWWRSLNSVYKELADGRAMILSALVFCAAARTFIFLVLPRGRLWQRTASASLFAVLVVVVLCRAAELLVGPKPLRWNGAMRSMRRCSVQHARERGHLSVAAVRDGSEPRAYRLPWSMQAASNCRRYAGGGGQRHRRADDHDRRGRVDQREPKFYARPSLPCPTRTTRTSGL